jgi:hypothetical protein
LLIEAFIFLFSIPKFYQMRKFLLIVMCVCAFAVVASAQTVFSADEQAEIKKVLGTDFTPVFSSTGELAITTKTAMRKVKMMPGGGFSKLPPGSKANNILIHSGWIAATSLEALKAMKSKLGQERFEQLEAIVGKGR